MEKNKRAVIIITIIILTILNLFIVFKKDNNIVEKNKVIKLERKEFNIYLQKTVGSKDYDPSTNTAFPMSGYLLNTTKTICYGYNGNKLNSNPVTQELTNDVINGSITINSNNTIYCDLYFDKNETPTISKFNVTGKTSGNQNLTNGFTYQTDNLPFTVTYTDTESDVKQYCINETNSIANCSWQTLSGTSGTYTLTNKNDGTKTMYIFLKDKANNISTSSSKSITVDKTAPVVTSFTLTGTNDTNQTLSNTTTYTHTKNIKYSATITETNMEGYCIYEGSSCSYQTTNTTTLSKLSFTLNDTEGNHTVNFKVKDKAGNESVVDTNSTKTITLDKTNPIATISSKSVTTNSITVTVGNSGTDISGIVQRQCKINDQNNWKDATPEGDCTINSLDNGTELKDGQEYTIQARVKDGSGRWSTNNSSVKVATAKKIITGKSLYDNPPKGMTETEIGEMKRFVGTKEQVDNWVCFGYNDATEDCKDIVENDYVYRIIGINQTGEIKLIKNKPLSKLYAWNSISSAGIEWSGSDLYKNINTTEYLLTLSNYWQSKIEIHTWPQGNIADDNLTAKSLYEVEKSFQTINAKIGLMTLSDYFYANAGENSKCFFNNFSDDTKCLNSWMFINNNNCSLIFQFPLEWTMQAYGPEDPENSKFDTFVWNAGIIDSTVTNGRCKDEFPVRPVFYLSVDTIISSGSGTSTDPFIIAM